MRTVVQAGRSLGDPYPTASKVWGVQAVSMDSPVSRLNSSVVALSRALDELNQIAQDPDDPTRSLESLAGKFHEIANHLDRYAGSLANFWADIQSTNERLLELVDPGSDADVSLAREHRDGIVRLREIVRASHADFDRLRALFDRFRSGHAEPELEVATHNAIRACQTLKRALETADVHATTLIDAYDQLFDISSC